MIGVLGFGPKVNLDIREKVAIINKHVEGKLKPLLTLCKEAVVISTCNRTEVFFVKDNDMIEDIIHLLSWEDYSEHLFFLKDEEAVIHLFELVCGFDSLIVGEEQILGQVREFYKLARSFSATGSLLNRLFEAAIACGKEFRKASELYKIPVSSASIVASEIEKRGIKSVLILGYGEVGRLCAKYLISKGIRRIYVAVRGLESIDAGDETVEFLSFKDKRKYMGKVDCIISCTSSPHPVIRKDDIPDTRLLIFDLAVPRDVEESVYEMPMVEVYDIDSVSKMNEENIARRMEVMENNRHIIHRHVNNFMVWYRLREVVPFIDAIRDFTDDIYRKRYSVFKNKYGITDDFAETLFRSTAYAFTNRAIEVLKEEYLNGRGDECLRILKKMFSTEVL